MNLKKVGFMLFLVLAILPAHKIGAQSSAEEKIIGTNTPAFLSKPIILIVNAIEKFRVDTGVKLGNTLFSPIFNNVFVFYGIFLVIIILLVRFICRLIF